MPSARQRAARQLAKKDHLIRRTLKLLAKMGYKAAPARLTFADVLATAPDGAILAALAVDQATRPRRVAHAVTSAGLRAWLASGRCLEIWLWRGSVVARSPIGVGSLPDLAVRKRWPRREHRTKRRTRK